ncbi:hypothetical protein A2716_02325 [candidate division WWE3 bacterium RIFCSPHIGHO2_01_FULL_40_23]|uniref:Nudix hydrolase domain-containing protein n=1 Tax=candidate division WWE3 bacterium RIFCSPLOWO2_01_FULL_41_18 TaxID=1802625 RepID=A0A1F4VEY5_UNCKA|nr:MAG: hypothetical protein A2716_02325 [candidate division WWE3 bacterium RIFCSPHIGHO2_01_FULL_40_23]OGC55821.1 MAG: hypothetical protein A3A78_02175 [candidate division WWE3 bacterium RIFCSPLOWO2_01_FULL_41_18]
MKTIALAIVKNLKEEVLIIKRRKVEKGSGDAKLTYAFPGGTVEDEEKTTATAVREAKEETGYTVIARNIISERNHPQFPVRVVYVVCQLSSEDHSQPDDEEVVEVLWVAVLKLSEYFTTDLDPKVAYYLGI